MAQITSGIRGLLSHPAMYNLSQNGLGVKRARRVLANEYMPQRPGLRMLDIGCGTAEILEFMPRDLNYVGFDASEVYIEHARRHYGDRGEFFPGLVGSAELAELGRFDVVLAFGVVHHLDDDEARHLFALAVEALNPGGVLLTVDPCFMPQQHWLAHWLISHDRGQNVRNEPGYRELAKDCFSRVESTPRNDFLRVPYTYLVMHCSNET